MSDKYPHVFGNTKLNQELAARAVEEYITQWEVLKKRDNIKGRIQRHKIAGLMAAAIVNQRPIVNYHRDDFEGLSFGLAAHNEKFAVYHGVVICAEGCPNEKFAILLNASYFNTWVESFVALFHNGSPCRDSLIHVFQTLCLGFFDENLRHQKKR